MVLSAVFAIAFRERECYAISQNDGPLIPRSQVRHRIQEQILYRVFLLMWYAHPLQPPINRQPFSFSLDSVPRSAPFFLLHFLLLPRTLRFLIKSSFPSQVPWSAVLAGRRGGLCVQHGVLCRQA